MFVTTNVRVYYKLAEKLLSPQEVLSYYEILRSEFPGAKLAASTIESFMAAVESVRDQLPVISKETGDTWIQGAASDPKKSAEYRAVARSLGNCFKSGQCFIKVLACTVMCIFA